MIGAGPTGMACALQAAQRGHHVTLYEANGQIGGQFAIAQQIPGKEKFSETLRYFRHQLAAAGVTIRLNHQVKADELEGAAEVIIPTGIMPHQLTIPGMDHPRVLSYLDVLRDKRPVGQRVAIIGAGGIGFDTAEFLLHHASQHEDFYQSCGIDHSLQARGEVVPPLRVDRQIWLLQRKSGKPGASLAKTTGWIHRTSLQAHGVQMWCDVEYVNIDDARLHLRHEGNAVTLAVDNIVICAGQEPLRTLVDELAARGKTVRLIGGAEVAQELDARRAIAQATELALSV